MNRYSIQAVLERGLKKSKSEPIPIVLGEGRTVLFRTEQYSVGEHVALLGAEITNDSLEPVHLRGISFRVLERDLPQKRILSCTSKRVQDRSEVSFVAEGRTADMLLFLEWTEMQNLSLGYLRPREAILGLLCLECNRYEMAQAESQELSIDLRVAGIVTPFTATLLIA